MKSTIIRMFAIITLATSISAFALPKEPAAAQCAEPKKDSSETVAAASTGDTVKAASEGQMHNGQEENSPEQRLTEQQDKQWLHDFHSIYQEENSRKERLIEQQDKQWLHDLLGIYGG